MYGSNDGMVFRYKSIIKWAAVAHVTARQLGDGVIDPCSVSAETAADFATSTTSLVGLSRVLTGEQLAESFKES